MRKSRFHDEKGNFADAGWLAPAAFALATAAAKRLFGFRLKRPMISIRATRALDRFLGKHMNAVEFGSGMSTPWLAARCGFLLSVEDHPGWAERVRVMLGEALHVRYETRTGDAFADLSDYPDGFFHFALIDGTDRRYCALSVLPKMAVGGVIYLDNSDKDQDGPGDISLAEEILLAAARAHGWPVRAYTDFAPTNFFAEQGLWIEVTSPYTGIRAPLEPEAEITLPDGGTMRVSGLLARHADGPHRDLVRWIAGEYRRRGVQ